MKPFPTFMLILLLSLVTTTGLAGGRNKKYRLLSTDERIERMQPDALPMQLKSQFISDLPEIQLYASGRINNNFREGIDVSHYQGEIDWQRVAEEGKVSYAYIKATEGASLVDRRFRVNIVEARQAGISVGSYHFYRPRVSVAEQFSNIVANINRSEQDLVPMIDVETTGDVTNDELVAGLEELADLLTRHYGRKPLIYTYQNFYNKYLVGALEGYQWMIAKYKDEEPVLHDATDYMMWQYSQTGRIPGIKGNVDRSRLMGSHSLYRLQL